MTKDVYGFSLHSGTSVIVDQEKGKRPVLRKGDDVLATFRNVDCAHQFIEFITRFTDENGLAVK